MHTYLYTHVFGYRRLLTMVNRDLEGVASILYTSLSCFLFYNKCAWLACFKIRFYFSFPGNRDNSHVARILMSIYPGCETAFPPQTGELTDVRVWFTVTGGSRGKVQDRQHAAQGCRWRGAYSVQAQCKSSVTKSQGDSLSHQIRHHLRCGSGPIKLSI